MAKQKPSLLKELPPIQRYGLAVVSIAIALGIGALLQRYSFYGVESLLGLKLAKVDGLEVLQQIKSGAIPRLVPVVVLTSSREERDLIASYKLGVNAYVVKPVDFHEFVNAIKELRIFWAIINEQPPGSMRMK
jgi:DNA-binding NarL/FixJ family response regulator